jgi:hypothetical protein
METSRLGVEGLTFFEKAKLGYDIASAGMQIAMGANVMAIPTDIETFVKISKEIHGVAKSLRVNYAAWERTLQDQDGIAGEQFKIVPTEAPQWIFVDELK